MKKVFSKRTQKKTKVKLSPKEAEDVIKQEFTDSRGNKHIFKFNIKPHSPKSPTIEGTIDYEDNK